MHAYVAFSPLTAFHALCDLRFGSHFLWYHRLQKEHSIHRKREPNLYSFPHVAHILSSSVEGGVTDETVVQEGSVLAQTELSLQGESSARFAGERWTSSRRTCLRCAIFLTLNASHTLISISLSVVLTYILNTGYNTDVHKSQGISKCGVSNRESMVLWMISEKRESFFSSKFFKVNCGCRSTSNCWNNLNNTSSTIVRWPYLVWRCSISFNESGYIVSDLAMVKEFKVCFLRVVTMFFFIWTSSSYL